MVSLTIAALNLVCLVNAIFFPNIYPRLKLRPKSNHKETGEPLFITPFLQEDNILLAQNLSRVALTDGLGVPSHAGFFTINRLYNSNLYFWYFPPQDKNKTAPVLLWLQGGPGGSSLFGLFTELGPLIVKDDSLQVREYHWALNYHLLFIDNPVGTGFSFTDNTNGYCTDESCVASGLYRALQQFFQLFPDIKNNDFYITGESYAGKYIPSLAMYIHDANDMGSTVINLKGMAMGNAYCDPINQLDWGTYLFQHGLLDHNELSMFTKYQTEITAEIKNENWLQANILMDRLMDGQVTHFSLFKYYTGYDDYYNYLETSEGDEMSEFVELLHQDEVRQNIHVGGLPFSDGEAVQLMLSLDMLQSVAPTVSKLLSHYRILFYNGQLDIIVAYPLTVNFLRSLEFSASEDYLKAKRTFWKVDDQLAGYVRRAGNLTEVLVRNAGHMVPKDQPKWSLDLITRFVNNDYKCD